MLYETDMPVQNEVSKTSAPAVPQSQSRWVLKSKLVSAHGLLVLVHGLKNELYSCVACLLRFMD